MKILLIILLGSLPMPIFSQTMNQVTLTLADENGANEVDIEISVSLNNINLESEDSADLTGTIDVQLNINPGTGKTDELTILSANVEGGDINLSAEERVLPFLPPVAEYDFSGTGLGFTAETTTPPGAVDPETGEFDASDHSVTVNRGMLNGSANTALTEETAVMYDFGTAPFSGAGSGTGTVTVTPGRKEGIKQYYDIVVELPISIVQEIELEDIDIEGLGVAGDIQGTIKAVGETFLEIPDYEFWARESGIASDSQSEFDLNPSIPNYFFFALGHDDSSLPSQLFTVSPDGVTLETSGEFALGDVDLEWSEDLENWVPVPQASMSSGSSSISFGDSFDTATTVNPEGAKKYFRVVHTPLG